MEKLVINEHSCKQPKNGKWSYSEDDFEFTDNSLEDLKKSVISYRISVDKSIENAEQDIYSQLSDKYPHLFKIVSSSETYDDNTFHELFAFLAVCEEYLKKPEIDLIANEREKICIKCKFHNHDIKFSCEDQKFQYKLKLMKITAGKSLKRNKLGFCEILNMDCRAAIYLHTEQLPECKESSCWIGKDLSDFVD